MDLLRSLPLGLYLENPTTWLHHLDPRVKLAWLMAFLLTPLLANPLWRITLVGLLLGLTILAAIPLRVWRQQMGWLVALCLAVLVVTSLMPDGLATRYQPRLPADALSFSQAQSDSPMAALPERLAQNLAENPDFSSFNLESQSPSYRYVLLNHGPITVTRRSLQLGVALSTWLFTLIYGTNLYLLTTAPEEITTAIERLLSPLSRWLPITEVTLTLTLALRFIPLVLEEIQNLVRSVRTRAINWQKLGIRGGAQIWLLLADRLLENLLLRAEQIASAMQVRGFTSPNHHQVQWNQLRMRRRDWVALASTSVLIGARLWFGTDAT
ncbi:hypothetical protein GS597_11060 [Synechococcales cyanobacterium C]|uniref:Cobalt transport protein n=1 Tax=Petrachloros mirabilis ULC683 TaxID=2781853 RepID=A0A8K1ZZL9_9CYAN|nr:CbiQ family ECF transporter T component [Petrachloros mirabilis]NCJ07036.1 hypothetical protein [Petrachloros mirabilis ULC683]